MNTDKDYNYEGYLNDEEYNKEEHEAWLRERPYKYMMGTPEETFLRNVWHFGLIKALHRWFETRCISMVCNSYISAKNNREAVRRYNFVLYEPNPYWLKFCSKVEFKLSNHIYQKRKLK